MAKRLLLAGGSATIPDNFANQPLPIMGALGIQNTDSDLYCRVRDSYTLSKMWLRISTNAVTNASVFYFRKNSGNGNQTISVPAAATGEYQDITHTDSIVSGDLINTACTIPLGGTNIICQGIGYIIDGSSTIIGWSTGTSGARSFNTTYYDTLGGYPLYLTTEAGSQYTLRNNCVLSNLCVTVKSNSVNGASTVRTRVNGGNGALSVSIGAATSGVFEDAVNTDNIISGNEANFCTVTGGAAGVMVIHCENVKCNNTKKLLVCACSQTSFTAYNPIEGLLSTTGALADLKLKCLTPTKFKNLIVNIPTNTGAGGQVHTDLTTLIPGNLTVTIPASTTGIFEDNTNSDTLTTSDYLTFHMGIGGNVTITYAGVEQNDATKPFPDSGISRKLALAGAI